MTELTASQPVLINRGMLYLDWNLGDPTPRGRHLGSTSRRLFVQKRVSSEFTGSSGQSLVGNASQPCIYALYSATFRRAYTRVRVRTRMRSTLRSYTRQTQFRPNPFAWTVMETHTRFAISRWRWFPPRNVMLRRRVFAYMQRTYERYDLRWFGFNEI